jgi:hypothetical protein
MEERRQKQAGAERVSFAKLARQALEKHVPEARGAGVEWGEKPNLGWLRWPREGGGYVYLALRRHLNWVTGEVGVSPDARDLATLELRADPAPGADAAWRVRLGHLLHDEDTWWPTGPAEKTLTERLEWLALEMRVKLGRLMRQPV